MALTQKLINVSFDAAGLVDAGSGFNAAPALSLSGLRISCHIEEQSAPHQGQCTLLIYGMTFAHMNALSTLGIRYFAEVRKQTVTVSAGDSANGMTTIFIGQVNQAFSDFQGGPNLPFHVEAQSVGDGQHQNTKPQGYNGSTDVTQAMGALAQKMKLQFEPNNVSKKIHSPYIWGSAWRAAIDLAQAANCSIAARCGVLAMWPKNGSRSQSATVSADNGMVGYPSWSSEGIKIRTLFNPGLQIGGKMTVFSKYITPANKEWTILHVQHDLETKKPSGQWFTTVEAYLSSGGAGGGGVGGLGGSAGGS